MNRTLSRYALAAFCGLAILSAQSRGSVVGVVGQGNILIPNNTPNTGATANFFDDTGTNRLVHAWDELQGVRLDRDIVVDIVAPGVYTGPFTSANVTIPQGTLISSHLLYFDPESFVDRIAQFTFDQRILGIIVTSDLPGDDRLFKTDFLGNPLTLYPGAHFNHRGIEFGPEALTMNPDLQTVRVDLAASNPGDQIRVITMAVPEPATGVLGGTGAAIATAIVRRRRPRVRAH